MALARRGAAADDGDGHVAIRLCGPIRITALAAWPKRPFATAENVKMLEKLTGVPRPVLVRAAFIGCIIALATLAWLPPEAMTRTRLGGHAEHFIAYLGTAIVTGLAFHRSPRLAVQCLLLIVYAAVLEAGQLYSPGRHASFHDLAFSSGGVVAGGLFLRMARSRMLSWLQ